MNAIEKRQYDMLVRVRDFGEGYGHLFPASSVARQNFATVAAAVRELDAQELAHMAASVSARAQRKTTAGEALLPRLQAISQTARVLAEDAPGLGEQFQVPHPASDQTLLTTRRKFARDAAAFSSQFLAQGMPSPPNWRRSWTASNARCAIAALGVRRGARRARTPTRSSPRDSPPSAASTPSSPTICATMR